MILVFKNHIVRKKNGISYNNDNLIMDREETSVKTNKNFFFRGLRNWMKANNIIFKDSQDFLIFSFFFTFY